MHPEDQQIIQQIEHLIGETLEPTALERLHAHVVGYALNEEERVVGLSLPEQGLVDIEPLSGLVMVGLAALVSLSATRGPEVCSQR